MSVFGLIFSTAWFLGASAFEIYMGSPTLAFLMWLTIIAFAVFYGVRDDAY